MPDWSYHPMFRPLLFRLPPALARDITLSSVGLLASLPFGVGSLIINLMGQMQIPSNLSISVSGLKFPGPVGLGAGLDVHTRGSAGLAQFGFGFLELGPVTIEPVETILPIERRVEALSICYPALPVNDGLARLSARLKRITPLPIPLGVRLAYQPQANAQEATLERCRLIEQLSPYADFFTLDICNEVANGTWKLTEWREHLHVLVQVLQPQQIPLFLCLAADLPEHSLAEILEPAVELGVTGVVAGCGITETPAHRVVGAATLQQSLSMVRAIRHRWRDQLCIIGADGVHDPADAIELIQAGATLVQIHSGLVYSGPGLPKRINEAVAHFAPQHPDISLTRKTSLISLLKPGWIWMLFLGIAMLIGGGLTGLVAMTRVVLPYDEAFVGLTRAQIAAINPHLLPFMTHDRVTLAGTMFSLGVLYFQLAIHGVRKGMHWAWLTIVVSCAVGFASFFLFLGFGYFDPLHAVLSLILLIFFCLGLRLPTRQTHGKVVPSLRNDRRWLLSQWGQLLFVLVGGGLTIAGLVIATVGVTTVFVPEDLTFMHITPHILHAVNMRLIPLIAHDRAGFGGALVSDGLGILLLALWGFRRGVRWIWWTLLTAGASEFLATIFIHLLVGYTNLWHLAPTVLAALPYVLGLALSYPYLCQDRERVA